MMIALNTRNKTPKYQQIIAVIEHAIEKRELKLGDKLPSINSIRREYKLSRDTVLMAYNALKNRGIITSVVGKGYYVASENVAVKRKIFSLFDELNHFKEDLYTSFLTHLPPHYEVDIFFHHFNFETFNNLISNHKDQYNDFVIMPANLVGTYGVIKQLPEEKVYILDQRPEELKSYPAIFQNFEKDIYDNLNKAKSKVLSYEKLILIFDPHKEPSSMLKGFKSFCEAAPKPYEVIEQLEQRSLEKGELYIIPNDRSLLEIIKKIRTQDLKVGSDIGIISYNDTLLKEVVEGGITTISTNFKWMGKHLAKMILNRGQSQIENPSSLMLRQSL